jgi:hypothetical protein
VLLKPTIKKNIEKRDASFDLSWMDFGSGQYENMMQ